MDLAHEKIVDDDIIGWTIKLVSDFDDLEFGLHGISTVKDVHCLEKVDESTLRALIL